MLLGGKPCGKGLLPKGELLVRPSPGSGCGNQWSVRNSQSTASSRVIPAFPTFSLEKGLWGPGEVERVERE